MQRVSYLFLTLTIFSFSCFGQRDEKQIASMIENLKTLDLPAFEERLQKEVGHPISLKPDWSSLKSLDEKGITNVGSTFLTLVSVAVNKEVPEAQTALKKIKSIELVHDPKQKDPIISKVSKSGVIKVTASFSTSVEWKEGNGPSAQLIKAAK